MENLTDTQFKNLRLAIYELKLGINRLQKIHRRETGKDFVISGPLSSEDEMAINIVLDEADPRWPIFVEIEIERRGKDKEESKDTNQQSVGG